MPLRRKNKLNKTQMQGEVVKALETNHKEWWRYFLYKKRGFDYMVAVGLLATTKLRELKEMESRLV